MRQSFLMNDRIYLRAVEPEDMDIMYEMENDPSMWDISNFTVPYSRYVLRQYIEGSQCDVFAEAITSDDGTQIRPVYPWYD